MLAGFLVAIISASQSTVCIQYAATVLTAASSKTVVCLLATCSATVLTAGLINPNLVVIKYQW